MPWTRAWTTLATPRVPGAVETYYKRSCDWSAENRAIETEVDFPVIAGEWSLAMDTCAMWLLGFNDMQPGEPRAICGAHADRLMNVCSVHARSVGWLVG